jgi:hypothetical protein
MAPHQERVIIEKSELDEKIEKLANFLDTRPVPIGFAEADRLQRQLDCMRAYSGILQERIDAFGEPSSDTEPDDSSEEE